MSGLMALKFDGMVPKTDFGHYAAKAPKFETLWLLGFTCVNLLSDDAMVSDCAVSPVIFLCIMRMSLLVDGDGGDEDEDEEGNDGHLHDDHQCNHDD